MSDKIKKYRWLPWAIAVVIVVLIAFIGSGYSNWYFLSPWAPARSLVAELSIDAFSAGIDYNTFVQGADAYWSYRLTSFGAILMTLVIGPSLWIYAEIKNQDRESKDVLKKGVAWYVGVVLVITSLQVVPTTIIKGVVFQKTWDRAAQSKYKDHLRSDLIKLGYDALELYHLPNEYGGGAGSFQIARANGDEEPLQLNDLESYSQIERNSYTLAPVESDSVIRIRGVNTDGSNDQLKMDMVVKPPASFDFKETNSSAD